MIDSRITMNEVARRVGLSPHVIRVWEKRYGAISPERTDANRRAYTEAEVERLTLLKSITDTGRRIGLVAQLSTEQLRELERSIRGFAGRNANPKDATALVETCLEAINELNTTRLEDAIWDANRSLGTQGALKMVLAPLLETIGEKWREGSFTAAHEHFATAVIRQSLNIRNSFSGTSSGPTLLVATPTGQLHELGALLISSSASALGWNVIYLGASLPAADIANAAVLSSARAVALSIVYPPDDLEMHNELTSLRRMLPANVDILAGGRAMHAYKSVLSTINASYSDDLDGLTKILDSLRTTAPKHA